MKTKTIATSIMALLVTVLMFPYVSVGSQNNEVKIVIFSAAVTPTMQDRLLCDTGRTIKRLPIINGVVVSASSQKLKSLAKKQGVLSIEDDLETYTHATMPANAQSLQIIPWGVDRIGADWVWPNSTGDGVNIAVIDSGIDLDHPDLATNI